MARTRSHSSGSESTKSGKANKGRRRKPSPSSSHTREDSSSLARKNRKIKKRAKQKSSSPPRRRPRNSGFDSLDLGPRLTSEEIEQFLALSQVDSGAAARLRNLPARLQRSVLDRGPLIGTKNPAAVLITRIRDAEQGRVGDGVGIVAPPPPLLADPAIERLIHHYKLDARAATMLRGLSPAQQQAAVTLPLHDARNPSAFVMHQLQTPRFTQLRGPVVPEITNSSLPTGHAFQLI